MSGNIILDIILGLSASLALIGLGGVAVVLSRSAPKGDVKITGVKITIEQDDSQPQVIRLPQDSAAVQELTKQGVHLSSTDREVEAATPTFISIRRQRSWQIVGLLAGLAVGLLTALPFVISSKFSIVIIAIAGGLILTSVGIILARLDQEFTRVEWKSSTRKEQAEAIVDAALLRDRTPHPQSPGTTNTC